MRTITIEQIGNFRDHLIEQERCAATVGKYIHDVKEFMRWMTDTRFDKSVVLAYKTYLCGKYAPASVNAALSSINSFFNFMGWYELRVKSIRLQRQIFASEERELTKAEYERLLMAAQRKKNKRLYLLMQTICSTGIRVSEVRSVTVEAVERGRADIQCKGKRRTVFFPPQLCKLLRHYIKEQKIKSGAVFVTKNGNPLDRSNIWGEMKGLCRAAGVAEKKVFPHNLRHLFARTYYTAQKDIVRLADILGHSSVNTTRIYTKESGEIHRRQIQRLGLLLC
ncbi:MAG: tyrosine-type recombinase/integrase [Clostridia bacterium]|nr:tyrosine-type recombinase/integrase [Clostridia bacterium]